MFFAFYTKVHSHCLLLSLRGFTATDSKMGPSISATILNFFCILSAKYCSFLLPEPERHYVKV